MKYMQCLILTLLLSTAIDAHSQALRLIGYEAEVVPTSGSETYPISAPTREACEDRFNNKVAEIEAAGDEVFWGRSGTQRCTPVFIYRSPTAPATSLSPAVSLWPRVPFPPVCLSCPIFDHPDLVKELYPQHHDLVMDYAQYFKIDQYNQDLHDLQNQYRSQLIGFEKKMFALEEQLSNKDK